MITNYESEDDMSPEMRAYSEHLRERAKAQGCVCRPVVTIDTAKRVTTIEHADGCPAPGDPRSTPCQN